MCVELQSQKKQFLGWFIVMGAESRLFTIWRQNPGNGLKLWENLWSNLKVTWQTSIRAEFTLKPSWLQACTGNRSDLQTFAHPYLPAWCCDWFLALCVRGRVPDSHASLLLPQVYMRRFLGMEKGNCSLVGYWPKVWPASPRLDTKQQGSMSKSGDTWMQTVLWLHKLTITSDSSTTLTAFR